jgi:1,5-anhydro-D-fructose reductase (1,5-anhydro-D-mannitol-forming)
MESQPTPVGFALIGCGRIAEAVHVPVLSGSRSTRLVAAADASAERRAWIARAAPHVRVDATWDALLQDPRVEAVIVALPTGLHAEAARAAFDAGKHVYCEKPLAAGLEDATRVVRSWRDSGRLGMIGFNYRFNELSRRLRRQLAAGRIGEVLQIRSVFSTTADVLTGWRQARRAGGGVLLDLAAHHIDLVRFIIGHDVVRVTARIQAVRHDDDTAVLDMELDNGVSAQSFFTYGSIESNSVEVFGRTGRLSVDYYSSLDVRMTRPNRGAADHLDMLRRGVGALGRAGYAIRKRGAVLHDPSYACALAHFASAARTGGFEGPDILDGYACAAIVEAAEESARHRRSVDVQATAASTA